LEKLIIKKIPKITNPKINNYEQIAANILLQLLEPEVHWDGPHTAKARSLQGEDMMLMELQNTALALKLCSVKYVT